MCEASLCSFVSFFLSCGLYITNSAKENPGVTLFISCIITAWIMFNIHLSRLLYGNETKCQLTTYDEDFVDEPENCKSLGEHQSPINIIKDQVEILRIQEKLTWNHYDDLPASVTIENNGQTVILRAKFDGNTPTVYGCDLVACYMFVQICFRWSHLNFEGSEHGLDGKKYPLEMQVMNRTRSLNEHISSYDLLMIGYLFEISTHNPYLDPLVLNLHRIQKAGTQVNIPPFPLSWLCHTFRTNFYSYGGSLTEKPYYEGVEWFILPETIAINEAQLAEFRSLKASDGSRIIRNTRPLQVLSEQRVVRLNQFSPVVDRFLLQAESCDSTTAYD